jgi:signal transduction histidine kinase
VDLSIDCGSEPTPLEPTADPVASLARERAARRRAEWVARMQAFVVERALDLAVREPDIDGFFGALTQLMVEEGEGCACGVWLIDESAGRCGLWMVYVRDQLYALRPTGPGQRSLSDCGPLKFPYEPMAAHLFGHAAGWKETVVYPSNDPRLPEAIRAFNERGGVDTTIAAPLVLGQRTFGWMTIASLRDDECGGEWRVALLEAIARQGTLALHHSRLAEQSRLEERRKAILEERNRLARDIHDNLAQGFAAILMQLQGAQREGAVLPPAVAAGVETAVEIARTHLAEARRSVGALRPNVGDGEDIATALKRLADRNQRASAMPIDVVVDELPRFGDVVEREIIGIAQEALTNAVRHSRGRRVTIRASTDKALGVRLSVADDGRGIARDQKSAGFGMTSMQERADRIGASLTIVTAPRRGTEVVLAWEPTFLPAQVHVAV